VGIPAHRLQRAHPRSFHFHDLLIAENVGRGVTWQCCGDSGEDLDGWPGDKPVLIERATIVGNGGPGVEARRRGLMEVRDSDRVRTGSTSTRVAAARRELVGVDPLFTSDYRLSLVSPAVAPRPAAATSAPSRCREC